VQGNPKTNQHGAREQREREREERAMKQDREGEKGKKGEPAGQGRIARNDWTGSRTEK